MKMSNVPLGSLGQILVAKESGVIGTCVASFWPLSGAPNEISVRLRTSTGAIYELPLFSVKRASDKERDNFLRQARKK
jgi:hypothetical protein